MSNRGSDLSIRLADIAVSRSTVIGVTLAACFLAGQKSSSG